VNPDLLAAIISAASSAGVAITALILNQRGFTTIENRITDLSNRLTNTDNRIEGTRAEIHAEMRDLRDEMRNLRAEVREDIKLLIGKVVEIDNRLGRIEDRIGPSR
jgi:predicted  nucleic acid-binding Zn-ribbon protein